MRRSSAEERDGPIGPHDERGAFMVLYALLVVAVITMAAVVVDLAAMRQDKRLSRAVADAASTAGAARLIGASGSPLAACNEAWNYAARNLGVNTPPASPCAPTFTTSVCTTGAARTVSGTIAGRTVTITNPVPDTSPYMRADLSGGGIDQPAGSGDDVPCSRVAVHIEHTRPAFFGGVAGAFEHTTRIHSVARGTTAIGSDFNIPVLVVLNRHDCSVIDAQSATIEAQGMNGNPGIMRSDSDGTGANCNGGFTITGQGSGRLIAQQGSLGQAGIISYFGAADARAYNTALTVDPDGLPPYTGNYSVLPRPEPSRLTRDRWDKEYHCSASVGGCTPTPFNPTGTDHINALVATYGGTGTPPGFRVFPSDPAVAVQGASCTPGSATVVIVPVGNWYVDCPTTMDLRGTMTFQGGTVVWRNGFSLRGNLVVNALGETTNTDTIMYIRNGGMAKQSAVANLTLHRTFVYIANGVVDGQAGGLIQWTSPRSGGFAKLLVWSPSTADHSLQGGPDMYLRGIFFSPNARMTMAGNAATIAQDVQFVVDRARTQGAAHLLLRGNPLYALSIGTTTTRLIR